MTKNPILTFGASIGFDNTITFSSDLGSPLPTVAIKPLGTASAHNSMKAAKIQTDPLILDFAIDFWENAPLLWQRSDFETNLTGTSTLTVTFKNNKPSDVGVSFPYLSGETLRQSRWMRTAKTTKNGSDVLRLFQILEHFKGPFYSWETLNGNRQGTQFKCSENAIDLALADRLSRAFRDTIRGNIKMTKLDRAIRYYPVMREDKNNILNLDCMSVS